MEPNKPHNFIPIYDASKPFPPSWSSYTEANQILGDIPALDPSVTHFSSPPLLGPQALSEPKYEQDSWNGQNDQLSCPDAALAVSESEQRLSGGKNPESMPKANLEGAPLNVASGSMVLAQEGGHEANNNNDLPSAKMQPCNKILGNGEEAQKVVTSVENSDAANQNELNQNLETGLNAASITNPKPKEQGLPSTKMQPSNEMLGNGKDSEKVTMVEYSAIVHHRNGSSAAANNPTKLNQNLKKGLNASGTGPDPKSKEVEEARKERKRKANRESYRRKRLKMKALSDLKYEQDPRKLSSDLPAGSNGQNDQLSCPDAAMPKANLEGAPLNVASGSMVLAQQGGHEANNNNKDEEARKERKRQANRESCKRTRAKKKEQYEELDKIVDDLRQENIKLRGRFNLLVAECSKVTKENETIMEELVEEYGEEAISNIKETMPEPPESIARIIK